MPEKEKPKLCLITVGCKANQYDSACLLGYLKEHFVLTAPDEETPADIYIINTCTVTHRADFEARKWIRKAKKLNPNAKIIITGCLGEVNREALGDERVDAVFGVKDRAELIRYLCGETSLPDERIFYHPQAGFQVRARALLKIQEGCDFRCSYCIVPYARGKSRSLNANKIIELLHRLKEQGFEEVVLCGINLGWWGKDFNSELADLIEAIGKENLSLRIRLSSLEPMTINERLIESLNADFICPHLHIPLQSGDDYILARMKRPYKVDDFKNLCERLFAKIDNLCLGLDIIVGFPGEGEEHFQRTFNLLEEIPFAYLHIFSFSPRPLTPAQRLKPKVPERIIQERSKVLFELAELKRRAYLLKQLNRRVEMLVENRQGEWAFGHSENYLFIKARTSALIKKRVKVRVKEITDGEIIAEEI